MVFGTVSDPLLAAALWVGSGAFASSGLLLAAIVALRVRLHQRTARERRLAAVWNPLIAECVERVPDAAPAVAAQDAEEFLLLWCRAQESLRGDARERLSQLARKAGAVAIANRFLRSGKPPLELLALVTLGHLREASVLPLASGLMAVAPPLISLTAAHALVRISPAASAHELLSAAARRDDWPLASIAAILKELDPSRLAPVLAMLIRRELAIPEPGPGVARLLRLHEAAQPESLRGAVLEVLAGTRDPETLAAALGALWHPDDKVHARLLAKHPEWLVRVAAARALARVGSVEDAPLLTELLHDPVWWVRYRAAGALCSLAAAQAEELCVGLGDGFARDALRQAIADRAYS